MRDLLARFQQGSAVKRSEMFRRFACAVAVCLSAPAFTQLAVAQPVVAQPPAAPLDGATLFAQNCSACHQLTGKGIPGAFPALAGDPFVMGPPEPVVMRVLNGKGGMPSFRADLTDPQIAAILSHVRSSWGNNAPPVPAPLVSRIRGAPKDDAAATPLQAH